MKKEIRLAVVEDQLLFRKGIISLIDGVENLSVIIEATDGKDLIKQLEKQEPDVILLDIEMPKMDGYETTEYLKKYHPGIKILILTMYNEKEIISYLIENGAHGFLLKNDSIETIVDAIRTVTEYDFYFNSSVTRSTIKKILNSEKPGTDSKIIDLSQREVEVIKLIGRGYTNKEIASKLFISVRTVDGHREKILDKTKARNAVGIAMYALKNGLLVVIKKKK